MNLPPPTSLLAFPVFLQGLALSLGLIVAIGAQNAFVLRQGLRREHVGSVVLFCAMADALLIIAGVMGMAQALADSPGLARALALAGALFLAAYGWQALRRARQSQQLKATEGETGLSRGAALAQAAAFTLLNPHVYLDTVLLLGSIGAQQPAALRGWFLLGACSASLAWFALLGFGSRWLAPLFARPRAWQVLDGAIAVTMFVLSALLLQHVIKDDAAIGIGQPEWVAPTGSPEAVTRPRFPQNVACGFPALRSSAVGLQYSDSLQGLVGQMQLWSHKRKPRLNLMKRLPRDTA